jgi:hypothetical protein
MIKNKYSLTYTNECIKLLLDYESMSNDEFNKYVDAISNIHLLEFGMNAFLIDFNNEFRNNKLKTKKDIFNKLGDFVQFLNEKDEA